MDKNITKKSVLVKITLGLLFSLLPFLLKPALNSLGIQCDYVSSYTDAVCLKWWFICLSLAVSTMIFVGIIFLIWGFFEERKRNKQNNHV